MINSYIPQQKFVRKIAKISFTLFVLFCFINLFASPQQTKFWFFNGIFKDILYTITSYIIPASFIIFVLAIIATIIFKLIPKTNKLEVATYLDHNYTQRLTAKNIRQLNRLDYKATKKSDLFFISQPTLVRNVKGTLPNATSVFFLYVANRNDKPELLTYDVQNELRNVPTSQSEYAYKFIKTLFVFGSINFFIRKPSDERTEVKIDNESLIDYSNPLDEQKSTKMWTSFKEFNDYQMLPNDLVVPVQLFTINALARFLSNLVEENFMVTFMHGGKEITRDPATLLQAIYEIKQNVE